jgi:Putative bacterial sensory transduction regulator
MYEALTGLQVDLLACQIDTWLGEMLTSIEYVLAVDRGGVDDCGPGERRWYVRLAGDAKDFTTVWFTLGQRSLRYETYVLPAPPVAALVIYESILRRNTQLVGCHYAIGGEDALYLRGELASVGLVEPDLDRIIGTLLVEVERSFPRLVSLAFPRRS